MPTTKRPPAARGSQPQGHRPLKPKPSPELKPHPSGKPWLEVAISLGATHLINIPEDGKTRCSEVIEWKPQGKRPIAHRWFYTQSQLKRDSLAFRERRAQSVVEHIEAQTTVNA